MGLLPPSLTPITPSPRAYYPLAQSLLPPSLTPITPSPRAYYPLVARILPLYLTLPRGHYPLAQSLLPPSLTQDWRARFAVYCGQAWRPLSPFVAGQPLARAKYRRRQGGQREIPCCRLAVVAISSASLLVCELLLFRMKARNTIVKFSCKISTQILYGMLPKPKTSGNSGESASGPKLIPRY